jgi:hypothetical protein
MILRLASDQCAGYWEDIKNVVAASIPTFADSSQDGMNQVLANLLDGHAQAWVGLDGQVVVALAITLIQIDTITGVRNLLIYALAGYGNIRKEIWEEGFKALKVFASANDCRKILAFSSIPRIIEVATTLGGNCDVRVLEWEV